MTVRISMAHTTMVAGRGAYLAMVRDDDIDIWPQGLGVGPMITMSRDDWSRIAREVMLALVRAEKER